MARIWITILLITAAVVLAAPACGAHWINPFGSEFDGAVDEEIFWQLRVPRVLLGFLVGGGLAVAGVAFQGMFRNALASPFTLGISSGAALGASLAIYLSATISILGLRSTSVVAMIGAALTAGLIWGVARRRQTSTLTILLTGVVLSFLFSSLIMLLQYLGDFGEVFRMTHWMLGSLEVVGFGDLFAAAPFIIVGTAIVLLECAALNLLSLGEEFAQSRGVSVRASQLRILAGAAFITGGVVSVCGPIGFVGIIVPYFTRWLTGFEHRRVMPISFFLGGIFLVVCDTTSRTLFSPLELPVGICTAMLGAPVFLWMLLGKRGYGIVDTTR